MDVLIVDEEFLNFFILLLEILLNIYKIINCCYLTEGEEWYVTLMLKEPTYYIYVNL